MPTALIVQLVVLLAGVLLFAATLLRWKRLTSRQRATGCAVSSALMAGSSLIGNLS